MELIMELTTISVLVRILKDDFYIFTFLNIRSSRSHIYTVLLTILIVSGKIKINCDWSLYKSVKTFFPVDSQINQGQTPP